MKTFQPLLVLFVFILPGLSWGQEARSNVNPGRLSFYAAELVCPAAPKIGCGSAAKPILLQLERDENISEAWLNRAGTIVAVVWKSELPRKQQLKAITSAIEGKPVAMKGTARRKAQEEFISGKGWYRGAEVDRLSEEEAGIIAARLVRRIGKQISLSEEKSKAIEEGITSILKRKLTGAEPMMRAQVEDQILAVCREHLNEDQIAILKRAQENGAFSNLRQQATDGP